MTSLPFTCPACGERFGYGSDAPLLCIVQSAPFHEQAPCCGAWLTGTLHRNGTVDFDEIIP